MNNDSWGEAQPERRSGEHRTLSITIHRSHVGDGLALGRLAQLDGTLYSGAPALIAEVDGVPVAALPLDGARAFADPFRRTAELVAMLELRREQLEGSRNVASPLITRALRAVRRRRRYRAPASA